MKYKLRSPFLTEASIEEFGGRRIRTQNGDMQT